MTALDSKLLDKIKALVFMSTDVSTTEHERKLALKRAQELMAKHSLNLAGLDRQIELEIVKVKYNFQRPGFPTALSITDVCLIAGIVGTNYGCYAYYNPQAQTVTIMGFQTNCEIAIYTMDMLINQGILDCRLLTKDNPSLGFKINFWQGFIQGLAAKFTKLSDEQALVLYDKVRQAFEASATKQIVSVGAKSSAGGYGQGFKSAKDAHLNAGIKTQSEAKKIG